MLCIVVYANKFMLSHMLPQHSKSYKLSKRKFLTNIEVVLHPYLRKKKKQLKLSDKLARAVDYRKLWSNGELNNDRMVQPLL